MNILKVFDTYKDFSAASMVMPYVIAEAGVNHEGSMDAAKRLIDEAKEGGADAVKFQAYKAHTLASKLSPAYWDTTKEPAQNQYELFKKNDKFWKKEFEELKEHCGRAGIEFMSTPFDMAAAEFLNDLVSVFKISSSDITNKPFIEHIAHFGKPVLLSTGASTMDEVREAVGWIEASGNPLALLHCILNYPTAERHANLGMIVDLKKNFPEKPVGYSDHTLPADMKVLEVAALLGAVILEKHFTHDKTLPGNDHYHSMDKEDLKMFRKNMERVLLLAGSFNKHSLAEEEISRKNARRSLVAKRFIPKGKIVEREDILCKRPANGISPKFIDDVVGKVAAKDIHEDETIVRDSIHD